MFSLLLLFYALVLGFGSSQFIIRNLYYICQPSEVLIFSGTRTRLKNSQTVGYRLVKGGSSIQLPIFEKTFRMNLTNMIIDLKVVDAYSKGGIPLTVSGVANIKIAGTEPTIHNAIERLLGKGRDEIEKLAKETLEGNLRGVLASLTPEEANSDQIAFARNLLEEAEEDLEKLGLMLDGLQIQTISDNVDYLDSIGRKQQAELIRDARIAEAQAKAESAIRDSSNNRETVIRELLRDEEVAKIEAAKDIRDALTRRTALVAEVESVAGTKIVEVEAEIKVEKEQIIETQQRLIADVLAPAEAQKQRLIAEAKGQAAHIIEDGKAQAIGLKRLGDVWKTADKDARDIFLYQKIDIMMNTMVESIPKISVQDISVIDAESGSESAKIASLLEQFSSATGIDPKRLINKLSLDSNHAKNNLQSST